MDKEKNITVKELMSSFYDRDVENLTLSQIFTIRSLYEICNLNELSKLVTSTAQAFEYEIDIYDFNVQNIDEILSAFNKSSNIKNIKLGYCFKYIQNDVKYEMPYTIIINYIYENDVLVGFFIIAKRIKTLASSIIKIDNHNAGDKIPELYTWQEKQWTPIEILKEKETSFNSIMLKVVLK